MTDAHPESIIANMALSLSPGDRDAFALAAMAAVEAMTPELRGPGSIHRVVEAEWRRFFKPPDGFGGKVLGWRVQGAEASFAGRLNRRLLLAGC
jgi:hypothetical protein